MAITKAKNEHTKMHHGRKRNMIGTLHFSKLVE
jgi:hypothetical protein